MPVKDTADTTIRHIHRVPKGCWNVTTERFASGSKKGMTISLVAHKEIDIGPFGYSPAKIRDKSRHSQLVLVMSRADAIELCSQICTALKHPLSITKEKWDKDYS